MADNVEVNRSIQFVSIDTHPANNALVVTYEIVVIIVDGSNKKELWRRNKRAQLQIYIKEFDQLEEKDFRVGKIDLGRISSRIIEKCPLLLSSSPEFLEDIQLHLLYLLNRRQTNLLTTKEHKTNNRPISSSASTTSSSRSASIVSGGRLPSGSLIASTQSAGNNSEEKLALDIYRFIRVLEVKNRACCFDFDKFDVEYNRYLDSIEISMHQHELVSQITQNLLAINDEKKKKDKGGGGDKIDNYLEGLYGDRGERFLSLAILRRLCMRRSSIDDENHQYTNQNINCHNLLANIGSNRLIISAMIRNLRDSSVDEYHSREFILYCLIRLTSYRDIYLESFDNRHLAGGASVEGSIPIDLVKILYDLLNEYLKNNNSNQIITSSSSSETPLCGNISNSSYHHYYLCAILVVLINLIKISQAHEDPKIKIKLEERILSNSNSKQDSSHQHHHHHHLGIILSELFQINTRDFMRQIRSNQLVGKPAKPIVQLLNANAILMRQLSSMKKEFIHQIRPKNQYFESIVNLLNCLQLSRPGSGNTQSYDVNVNQISDNETLCEFYHLELNLFMLCNNLLMDSKIRAKFIKRKLLKPVLRNLVIFLASSSSSNLITTGDSNHMMDNSYYDLSLVLMVPFRSLYELSCDKSVRLELFKSKIIMKCLLEYLLMSCQQEFLSNQIMKKLPPIAAAPPLIGSIDGAISLEPTDVSHYILGVWINLSAIKEAPIYSSSSNNHDDELKDLLCEYIDIILDKLRSLMGSFISSSDGINHVHGSNSVIMLNQQQEYNSIYLHMKLLRNISQFMQFNEDELIFYEKCLNRLSDITNSLLGLLSSSSSSSIVEHRQQSNWLRNSNIKPYLVECLAILGNLIGARPSYLDTKLDDCFREEEDGDDVGDSTNSIASQNTSESLASIFSKLFQLKCEDFIDEEDDDLLLVSIQLIGFFANKLEICLISLPIETNFNQEAKIQHQNQNQEQQQQQQLIRQKVNLRILRACFFVLDTKLADYKMIIHTLYSLSQLMNHSQFLKTLLLSDDSNADEFNDSSSMAAAAGKEDGSFEENHYEECNSNLNRLAELLVDKLTDLVLHTGYFSTSLAATATTIKAEGSIAAGGKQEKRNQHTPAAGSSSQLVGIGVSKLALDLLNLFRQLEQQTSIESSFVYECRFANYNSKWLAAIQSSREALESPRSSANHSAPVHRVIGASGADAGAGRSDSAATSSSWFVGKNILQFDDEEDEDQQEENDNDEFGNIRGDFKRRLSLNGTGQQQQQQQLRLQPMMEEDEDGDANVTDKQDDEDNLNSSDSASSSFGEAPDLNVIDPNSMIKHLSSRRQLRQMR